MLERESPAERREVADGPEQGCDGGALARAIGAELGRTGVLLVRVSLGEGRGEHDRCSAVQEGTGSDLVCAVARLARAIGAELGRTGGLLARESLAEGRGDVPV